MTRWLLGGVALTVAALSVIWWRPVPGTSVSRAPSQSERPARRLSTAPARPLAPSAPPRSDGVRVPAFDTPEDDDLAEATARAEPLATEPLATEPLATEPPAEEPAEASPEASVGLAPAAPELPVAEPADETPAAPASAPAKPRRVSLIQLQAWSEPGMCVSSSGGAAARASLLASFQFWDGGEHGQFRVDPRLPLESIQPILGYFAEAERAIATRLKLQVARPETFLYFDQRLLKAAACVNPEVVAYYDGSLHVVPGDADVRTSVIHEYTHHALFSSGLKGPAWAHEGIAMNMAQENWWMDPRWLAALLDHPLAIDDLDERVPYKLVPEQALEFYAQSAALVACVLERRHWGLDALFAALGQRANDGGETLIYELPEVEFPSFLRGCVQRWSKAH